jgi:peroxiredoxin Q/BCP
MLDADDEPVRWDASDPAFVPWGLPARRTWHEEASRFVGVTPAESATSRRPDHAGGVPRRRPLNALRLGRCVTMPSMSDPTMPAVGDPAPDFELPDQDGTPTKLSDLRGKRVVLYFYPKADTPGCTTQACGVRDHVEEYDAAGAVVLGVSPDPVKAVKKFHEKQGLNFALLADSDHAVAERYGVWVEKSMYGRTYMGNERTTFVIGADGVVSEVLRKVKPKEHDALVLGALA